MLEVFDIWGKINKMCHSKDVLLRDATVKMKKKYEKYWGKPGLLNMLLLMSSVLDPRYKLRYVNWSINDNFSEVEAKELRDLLEARFINCLQSIVMWGKGLKVVHSRITLI